MIDPERRARAGLSLLRRPEAAVVAEVRARGAAAVWERVGASSGIDPDRQLDRAAEVGARFVVPDDPEWPAGLLDLDAYPAAASTPERRDAGRDLGQPFGLWVRGGPLTRGAEAVAVVGARAATDYGTMVALDLGTGLVERDLDVVSGGAFGIDAAAHRGALAGGGRTVAVLACGVDVAYPRAHEALLSQVARAGVVVSEMPPGEAPSRGAFLRRNRIIAALTAGTVLVEAGLRSGARNTVAHAAALGRVRMVVPGPVTAATSAGAHAVLRADPEARLVTCAADVAEEIGRVGTLEPLPRGPVDLRDLLGRSARVLLELLPAREAWSTSRVAAALALSPPQAEAIVEALTAHGLLEAAGDGVRLSQLGRRPTVRSP